jgi:hypothetical protein
MLDGSALINALPSRISKTFEEYADQVIFSRLAGNENRREQTTVVL